MQREPVTYSGQTEGKTRVSLRRGLVRTLYRTEAGAGAAERPAFVEVEADRFRILCQIAHKDAWLPLELVIQSRGM
jgi:hypothetical protein